MGTINYKTSEYITIGYNLNNIDYENYEDDQFFIEDAFQNVKILLEQQHFYYWHLTLEPGYYEGFSIDIEYNFPYCFDNYIEKREALKECTQIREFLKQCINNFECCVIFPGWCTTYHNYKESMHRLNIAINEMRNEVRHTPTYRTLPESEKIPLF